VKENAHKLMEVKLSELLGEKSLILGLF